MSDDIYEIYDEGFMGCKRLLKNGKAINEFGMLKELKKAQEKIKELEDYARTYINVDDELPKEGECVLVYRPQVLTDDHTDKPLVLTTFKNNDFSCFHDPKMWMRIKKPDCWNEELEKRQIR